ncbi:hypothetical protein LXL04_019936 [Taraxacum kok-saghyz]
MDGVYPEQEHSKFLYLASKKSFRDLDIPPRKLLSRRLASLSPEQSMELYHQLQQQQNDSPRVLPEETLLQKFLPYNSGHDNDSDPYASDEFRMYEFKIRKCTRSRSHDWTDCPFAHPGEKARRRCPRRYNYSGNVCADFRRGSCSRGDACEFAHGVFECWLHPFRYRTEACKDGKNCQRKICFFAHTPKQLRSMPVESVISPGKHLNSGHCSSCRCHPGIHHANSPTSILDIDKLSPPTSPPFSTAPTGSGFSPVSRFSDRLALGNFDSSYRDSMNELMHSMKALNMSAVDHQAKNMNPMWMDAFDGTDHNQRSLFGFSPSTHSPSASGSSRAIPRECNIVNEERETVHEQKEQKIVKRSDLL